MKIGKMNKLVTVYKAVETPDGGGGNDTAPQMVGRSWCDIKPASDYAVQSAAALKQVITHKITIRYRKDLNRDCWFDHKGRVFDILSIKNIEERNRFLEIKVKERAA